VSDHADGRILDLSGDWRILLDPDDRGISERWFEQELSGSINLPGTLAGAGIGEPVSRKTKWTGRITDEKTFFDPKYERLSGSAYKPPFWPVPDHYYNGAAWYQKIISIPNSWAGLFALLELERPHWETSAWLDAQPLGTRNALSTPHRYEVGAPAVPGSRVLTIRIDNSYKITVGMNAHSVTDNTNGNWNGIVGNLHLCAFDAVRIEHVAVHPDLSARKARAIISIANR